MRSKTSFILRKKSEDNKELILVGLVLFYLIANQRKLTYLFVFT